MTTTTPQPLLTNEDFAVEVKSDRLRSVYQLTAFLTTIVGLFLLTFGLTRATTIVQTLWAVASMIAVVLVCLTAHLTLRKGHFSIAAWIYSLGMALGLGGLLYASDDLGRELIPYFYPALIFIAGLLLSPRSTLVIVTCATLSLFLAPYLAGATANLSMLLAFVLMIIAALLAARVTGELYLITEWALENYQRERATNIELFDKREQLTRNLYRSEALSQRLSETNQALEQAHQQAEEAKNQRGIFLRNMSHELRTPLNAIIGFSETMLNYPQMYDDLELPQAYSRDIAQIANSGRQLLHVIDDILDLAKVDAGKLEIQMKAVESLPIILAVNSTARGLLAKKPVKLDMSVPEELPLVWADESRLRQVLLNLYSNATKYTDEGSIFLTVETTDEELVFHLRDTGIGIPKEDHDKLFKEFQQAQLQEGRDPRSGTGLGLAISKQLLDFMGGRIWFESAPGQGSTFSFAIQRYRGQEQQALPQDAGAMLQA